MDRIGAYEVERLVGAGSFATVWLARDPVLGGHVAIKVLADNWSHDLRVRERFLEEGRLLWRLDDDHLVRVHGVGELPDGRPYLVMAYADRGSLQDRIDAGPPPPPEALELLARVADCVAVLHRHRIVHRDLTPANVLFRTRNDGTEQVVVGDLGLAKALAAASGVTGRAGTPGYMAPEQDRPVALVDARSDVFALGVLGRRLLGDAAAPPVAALLAAATAVDPDARPEDAAAFARALRAATAGAADPDDRVTSAADGPAPAPLPPSPPTATPAPGPPTVDASRPVDRAAAPRRRRRAVLVGIVLATLAAVAGGWAVASRRASGAGGVSWDRTRRVGITAPAGWRVAGTGWRDRPDAAGRPEPAFVVSPDPSRWPGDPTVPGAFVGLSPTALAAGDAAAFLAGRTHAGCAPATTSREAHAERTWTVVVHAACTDGRTIVEAATVVTSGLLYVQHSAPTGAASVPVGALLDAVVVS